MEAGRRTQLDRTTLTLASLRPSLVLATLVATWPHVHEDQLHDWWMQYSAALPAGATLGDALRAVDDVWPLTLAQIEEAHALANLKCMARTLEPRAREREFAKCTAPTEREDGAYECVACMGNFGSDDIVLCTRDHAQCRACFIQL